jgi:hypothetical protein
MHFFIEVTDLYFNLIPKIVFEVLKCRKTEQNFVVLK